MKRAIVTVFALVASTTALCFEQPRPVTSEFLKTTGGGMFTDVPKDNGHFYFGLTLEWVKRPPSGAIVVAEFENKENAAAPYVVEQLANREDPSLVLRSPLYPCVTNNSYYRATVKVFADADKTRQIAVHEQQIGFALPANALRAVNAKVCGA